MTHVPEIKYHQVGNLYGLRNWVEYGLKQSKNDGLRNWVEYGLKQSKNDGLRNWVEYGLKQSKNELGWADFRVTDYAQIQKWWEV
jgi:SRSO17 transposase